MAENADTIFTDSPLEGDEAEIGSGPFHGERGTVTRVLPARQRVQLLLDVMGRSLPAEVSLSSILFKRRTLGHRILSANRTDQKEAVALAI